MLTLTAKQSQTYDFIRVYFFRNGYPPTIQEIANELGIRSRGVIHRYLKVLVQKELIELEPNKKRNIRLTVNHLIRTQLPIVGEIDELQTIKTSNKKSLDLTRLLLDQNCQAIKVEDDSLATQFICKGDYILFRLTNKINNEDLVVANCEDGCAIGAAELKNDGDIYLISKTSKKKINKKDIKGIYLGVIRI